MKEVYAKSVMPCWRGLCTSHLHRPFTIYPWQSYEQFLKLARISGSFLRRSMKKPSIDAEVFGDETHLAGGVIVVVTLVGIAMTVEVGDKGFCQ